jgi:peptide/nickel transport system substrate-binding protein
MYLPYYRDSDGKSIMNRNDDWWGIKVFGHGPAPKYLGYKLEYITGDELVSNDIDWCGDYVPGIDTLIKANPNLHTYLFNPPYFVDKSALLMVPNHRQYPLGEPWLDKAITSVINCTALSMAASSGYLKAPSPLLIPADDGIARLLLNTTIENEYRVPCDPTGAYGLALLNQYCIKVNGQLYTKDGPSQDFLTMYNETLAEYPDALPNTPGVNIPLGPWTIMTWTDANQMDVIDATVASMVTNTLGIQLSSIVFGWTPEYRDRLDYYIGDFSFQFADVFMMRGIDTNLYERYTQLFTGTACSWQRFGDYRNATLENLINQLDSVPANSQVQQNIANQIETIVGQDLPIIPMIGQPDYYIFSDKYWQNWPDQYTDPLLPASPVSPFVSSAPMASLQALIFRLLPKTADLNGDGTINMLDMFAVARAFGTHPGGAGWSTLADLNDDRVINIVDIFCVARNFGQKI